MAALVLFPLSACTLVTKATGEAGTITFSAPTLLITNPGTDAITNAVGCMDNGPALNVRGVNIKPDAVAVGVRWRCNLPEIPANADHPLRVTFVADVGGETPQVTRADLAAYRPSLGAKLVALFSR